MSKKIMEWICYTFKEASKDKKNLVWRWKTKDTGTNYFSTRKYNAYGRYMSILALNGEGRSTLIIPEAALNAKWLDITFKIERFINSSSHLDKTEPPRLTEAG